MLYHLKPFNLKVINLKNGSVRKKKKFSKQKNKLNKDGILQLILLKEFFIISIFVFLLIKNNFFYYKDLKRYNFYRKNDGNKKNFVI